MAFFSGNLPILSFISARLTGQIFDMLISYVHFVPTPNAIAASVNNSFNFPHALGRVVSEMSKGGRNF